MLQKMMKRFYVSDENLTEKKGYLGNINQNLDTHALSIKNLSLQMAQLSTTVNPRQPCTIPRNTIRNPKNNGRCIAVIK